MTALGLVAGLGLAAAIGLAAAWPALRGQQRAALLAAAAALPLGLGGTSAVFFLWRLWGGSSLTSLAAADLGLLAVLVLLGRAVPTPALALEPAAALTPAGRVALALATAGAAALVAVVVARMAQVPHGGWDAWAAWDVTARFLSHGDPWWRGILDPEAVHREYPALLPSAVARLWLYAPGSEALAPAAVACAFALSAVAVPAAVLLALRGPVAAGLGGLLVAGTTDIPRYAASQYADVPLASLFVLGTGLLLLASARPARWPAALGAAALGLAAWTKNEGILMLAASGAAWLAWEARAGGWTRLIRSAAAFAGGAAAGLAALLPLKALVGPSPGWALGGDRAATLARVADLHRHAVIASAGVQQLFRLGNGWTLPALVVVVALLGLRGAPRPRPAWAFAALALIVAGEFAVYLVTPYPLEWQLRFSMDRLVMQLWPAACVLALLSTPAEASGGRPAGDTP